MKINKLIKVGEREIPYTITVDDLDADGNVIGQHEVQMTKVVPVMEAETVDMTSEEEAEALRIRAEANSEPTAQERIHQLEEQNSMLLECLLEMSEIVYA